jgi:hypothetical protein
VQFEQVEKWTSQRLSSYGVQLFLALGGLLYCFRLACNKMERRLKFLDMVVRLELNETKAYAAIASFKMFGRLLLTEPDLQRHFCMSSLVILSRAKATDAARAAAIELARANQPVSMNVAEALVDEHSNVAAMPFDGEELQDGLDAEEELGSEIEDTEIDFDTELEASEASEVEPEIAAGKHESSLTSQSRSSTASSTWTYIGSAVRISIEVRDDARLSDRPSIESELKSAIEKFRLSQFEATHVSQQSVAE